MRAILIRGSNFSSSIKYLKVCYFLSKKKKPHTPLVDNSFVKIYFYHDELKSVIGECTISPLSLDNFYRWANGYDFGFPMPHLNAFNAKIYERNIPISEFRPSNVFCRLFKKNLTKPPKKWCRVMDLENDNEEEIRLSEDSFNKVAKSLDEYYSNGEKFLSGENQW